MEHHPMRLTTQKVAVRQMYYISSQNTFCIKLKQGILPFILFLSLCSCAESRQASPTSEPNDTHISGTIAAGTIWNRDKSPYIVTGNITVPREVTLKIEAGTEIRFEGFYSLIVQGNLIADASSENQSIIFTSNQVMPKEGDWNEILFDNTNNDKSRMGGVEVKYAKTGIHCRSSSPAISRCAIAHNQTGIWLESHSLAKIAHNRIQNNQRGIYAIGTLPIVITSNLISHNQVGIFSQRVVNLKLRGNNLSNNSDFAVVLQGSNTNIDARDNWWGTPNSDDIQKQIFDGHDTDRIIAKNAHGELTNQTGKVIYSPFLTSPPAERW